ncbi:MAG TPA: alpha-ketoacid dehydrogenase subunit beta [Armatimonadetes bacterium]|nr:alpha-ketoacid dehydrogenase subunit beta [Armatimonadota bacterium]
MRELAYTEAISEAITEEMERDETVFSIGEDIGPVRSRERLWEQFMEKRAWQTPISESGFVGLATGAAMTGLRPIAVIMYCDFFTVCMDPIVNQAAKVHLMSGGEIKVPMVIRTPAGAGTREGGHHSGSLESWFVHSPGLKVVMPSDPYDAKGLMKSAIRDDGPVIYIQHRLLHRFSRGQCPEGEWLVPLGKASVKREGTDVTVIGISIGVSKALQAAEMLEGDISVEVVDPRSLVPLDMETILASVGKTGRLLVVHDAPRRGGVGAEIVRRVAEEGFDLLQRPPRVLGGLNTPMPYSAPLEDACLPQPEDIVAAVREIVN